MKTRTEKSEKSYEAKCLNVESVMAVNMSIEEIRDFSMTDEYKINLYKKESSNTKQKLMEINEFTKQYIDNLVASNFSQRESLKRWINAGSLMLVQKKIVSSLNMNWEQWVVSNCKIDMKIIEGYMKIAKVPAIERYYSFGLERLIEVAELIDSIHEGDYCGISDPIQELLNNLGIVLLISEHMQIPREILAQIDLLIFNYKVDAVTKEYDDLTMGLNQELLLEAMLQSTKAISSQEVKHMVAIKQTGGDPNSYVKDNFCNLDGNKTA